MPWFDPQEGIDWLDVVISHVRSNPAAVESSERLVQDLTECQDVLRKANAVGAKWHFGDGHLAAVRLWDNQPLHWEWDWRQESWSPSRCR